MGMHGRGVAQGRLGLQNVLGMSTEINIHFKKTGLEIQKAIATKIKSLMEDCESDEKEITVICERRGVDAKEVIAAANDENATVTYESKAFNNAPHKHNKLIEEMQADMTMLRQLSASIAFTKEGISTLTTIHDNIEVKREFDLTFKELNFFGF